jgi:uncharacterized protein (PEP-CTERM system associated)
LSVSGTHRLSSRLNAALNISYSDNETIVNRIGRDFGNDSSKYFTISPSLSWQWTRQLQVAFRYRYRKSERAEDDEAATGNAASVSLSYNFQKFSVSR